MCRTLSPSLNINCYYDEIEIIQKAYMRVVPFFSCLCRYLILILRHLVWSVWWSAWLSSWSGKVCMPGQTFVGCCHGDDMVARMSGVSFCSIPVRQSKSREKEISTKIPKEEVFRICMYLILEIIRYPSLTNPANTLQIRIPFILNQTLLDIFIGRHHYILIYINGI